MICVTLLCFARLDMKFDDPLQAHLGPFGLFLLRATASAAMAIETSALKNSRFFPLAA